MRALREVSCGVEVLELEDVAATFSSGAQDLWRPYLLEVVLPHKLLEKAAYTSFDAHYCVVEHAPEVKGTMVETCI